MERKDSLKFVDKVKLDLNELSTLAIEKLQAKLPNTNQQQVLGEVWVDSGNLAQVVSV